jgi:hypothetical protein
VGGELVGLFCTVSMTASEYLELRDAAAASGETMSGYAIKAIAERFNREHPGMLKFGERFRL